MRSGNKEYTATAGTDFDSRQLLPDLRPRAEPSVILWRLRPDP